MPPDVEPMLATSGVPPSSTGGSPSRSSTGGGPGSSSTTTASHVRTRSGRDITANVHGLEPLRYSGIRAVLDGELVAGGGRLTDFYLVGPTLARRRPVPGHSVAFAAFDLLWMDGELTTRQPYSQRRAILDDLRLAELGVPTIPTFDFDDAPALFRACAAHGVEGLVLKQLSAPYLPGKRTTSWRKVKCDAVGRAPGAAATDTSALVHDF